MNASSVARLLAAIFVLLAFGIYLTSRDSIGVLVNLPPNEVKAIVSQVEEWSSPKLFREIVIREVPDGNMSAWVRESGDRWSVTLFTNVAGSWRKARWALVEKDGSLRK
jgi:hypothetical protein